MSMNRVRLDDKAVAAVLSASAVEVEEMGSEFSSISTSTGSFFMNRSTIN